jgi:ceramide glucosyltransferase
MSGALAGFSLLALALHLLSIALAARRVRLQRRALPPPAEAPPVTVIRPVCGIEAFSRETLGSSFALNYPNYELLFCVVSADDPVTAIVYRLIDAHPEISARLLVGDDRVSLNPKLNNTVKGWDTAQNEWIIMADSNVLMPRDYVQRLLARWRHNTGVVCSVPIASRPANFWAELECAFLNTYEARWEYAADSLGVAFAQGKSMLMRKSLIERGGGIRALGAEIAEDAALTKLLKAAGLKVHLVNNPFEQPLGARSAAEVWCRQKRWSRLRRMTFPLMFLPELLPGAFFPFSAAMGFAGPCAKRCGRDRRACYGISHPMVRRRGSAGAHCRLALVHPDGVRLRVARCSAAAALDRCLARQQLHLARHCDAAARGDRGVPIENLEKKRPPGLRRPLSSKLFVGLLSVRERPRGRSSGSGRLDWSASSPGRCRRSCRCSTRSRY